MTPTPFSPYKKAAPSPPDGYPPWWSTCIDSPPDRCHWKPLRNSGEDRRFTRLAGSKRLLFFQNDTYKFGEHVSFFQTRLLRGTDYFGIFDWLTWTTWEPLEVWQQRLLLVFLALKTRKTHGFSFQKIWNYKQLWSKVSFNSLESLGRKGIWVALWKAIETPCE